MFYALRAASTAFIAAAGLNVVKIALLNIPAFEASGAWLDLFNIKGLILAAAVLFFTRFKKTKGLHPIVWIGVSAVVGVVFGFAGV